MQGHRGARGLRPENTLPGFELALDLLVDTLEMDLHLSRDDVVVVWHDPLIDSGKCDVDGVVRIRDLTVEQLGRVRCDRNPDPDRFPDQVAEPGDVAGDDYTIPTLAQVFELAASYSTDNRKTADQRANAAGVRFNIETKRDPANPGAIGDGFDGETMGIFEAAVVEAITTAGLLDRVTVQSFDHRSLRAIHAAHSDVTLAALTRRGDLPDFSALAQSGAAIWSPDHRSVDATTLAAAHDAGLLVIPWTVNNPDDMEQLLTLGVDGIITDRPDLAPSP